MSGRMVALSIDEISWGLQLHHAIWHQTKTHGEYLLLSTLYSFCAASEMILSFLLESIRTVSRLFLYYFTFVPVVLTVLLLYCFCTHSKLYLNSFCTVSVPIQRARSMYRLTFYWDWHLLELPCCSICRPETRSRMWIEWKACSRGEQSQYMVRFHVRFIFRRTQHMKADERRCGNSYMISSSVQELSDVRRYCTILWFCVAMVARLVWEW